MEIKKGDKVRVSKDAPRIYVGFADVSKTEFIVGIIDDGVASVHLENDEKTHAKIFVIPTKYLIKVEDESTATTIKLGDFVRVLENLHEPFCLDEERHLEFANIPPHAVSQKKWKVISIEVRRDCAGCIYTLKHDDSFIYNIPEDCVERVEPTEQTEAEETNPDNLKKIAEEWANNVSNAIEEYGDAMCKIYVEAHNEAYWEAYTADLAKEIAVKSMEKSYGCDPERIADYAVQVAKAVVENLKNK